MNTDPYLVQIKMIPEKLDFLSIEDYKMKENNQHTFNMMYHLQRYRCE